MEEKSKRWLFWRSWRSMRTQYALATALFILLCLSVFYIGGRIVLVHMVRDSEPTVRMVRETEAPVHTEPHVPIVESAEKSALNEAITYYSGGFWDVEGKPFELALYRLGFFIAFAGIVLSGFLFFIQNRLLLDPLTRMTQKLANIKTDDLTVSCPHIEWDGKDEFAQLAESVNRMIETIAARTLAIAHAEARHETLIRSLPDALVVFDSEGRFVSVMKDADGDDEVPGLNHGEPPSELVYGKAAVSCFLAAVRATRRTGVVCKVRMDEQKSSMKNKDQHRRHFEVRVVKMEEGFVLAIVSDTTEEVHEHKRLLQAEARIADSRKRESLSLLAAGIAHDMNNILSVVLNAAEAEGADPSGDSVKALDTIRDAVHRGTGMMRELQTYAGENHIALKRMHAGAILDDIRLLAEQVVSKNIAVTYESDVDAPDVDVDPDQFWKVLFNIVKNAGESIGLERPGQISVRCTRLEMTAEIAAKFVSQKPLPEGVGTLFSIQDDGAGISHDLIPKLFDPYVSSKSVNRGLGLATVRAIVEAHGGGLRVKSKMEMGTVFEVFLPESRLTASRFETQNIKINRERKGVLVVDDEVSILRTSSILLRAQGLVPHIAKDNAEALAVVHRHATELLAIILDADLNGVDTQRLLSAFRASASDVPVIVSSGSAEDRIKTVFAEAKYDFFLAKPYTLLELKNVLAEASTWKGE